MVKSSAPLLRSLMRVGKKQQRSAARLLTALFAPPKPAPKVRAKPKPKPAATATPKPAPKPRSACAPKPKPAARAAPASLAKDAPAPGKWLTARYAGQAGHVLRQMSYWLYLPDGAAPPSGWPLIVMLHGCEQSATQFAQGTRMNQTAQKAGYAVLYPQQSLGAHPHRCWKWYDRATQQGGGDVPVIVGMISQVLAAYGLDRSRVFIGGMSAGAGMANIVALNHPELFAGLGLHSGPLYGAGHSTVGALGVMQHGNGARVDSAIAEVLERRPGFPSMPTILIQGEDDRVVRLVNQAHLRRQAMLVNDLPPATPVRVAQKAGGRSGLPYQLHDVYRGRKLILRVAQIAQLQHAWSGGDARLSFNSAAGPDASKMLVDFFGKHRR
ncbi:PHB depolymerase family esterase [Massilia sp. CCM 8734]|uniref:extracellular catalytic domain type 1 short-chain-length polyhydroxyalkanoate depolymerase n=1 Tax=Massilia sp. CCM 8734 TaxID=2609283 RepID=UPI0014213A6C|nr:PHB depolymerase family esterase [Massilia sp. CCM 8734]NHZ98836.1 PHB depolymerase family esterase [Massilia sp. CCM 8734]